MNASVAIQTLPAAPNDEELVRIVDEVIAYIKSTGNNYYVGPFETTIEVSGVYFTTVESDIPFNSFPPKLVFIPCSIISGKSVIT